jgi:putative ABC transport system substrate-binding protein
MALLAFSLLAAPLPVAAQQPAKVARIGILTLNSMSAALHLWEASRQSPRDLGYVEGQNIAIELRSAEGKSDRLPEIAPELVCLRVDVIVTGSPPTPLAAQRATSTIPIVVTVTSDLVVEGLVASLARPGGNITGLASIAPELGGKHLELLKEVVPQLSRVAVLQNPGNQGNTPMLPPTADAARVLRLQLHILQVSRPAEIDSAFAAMTVQCAGGVLVLRDPLFLAQRAHVAALAAKSRLPGVYGQSEHIEAGGLMTYGPDYAEMYRRAATYVDKILKGAKPADLPVEQPTRLALVINMKTAKALGLTIPRSVLSLADQVIQ